MNILDLLKGKRVKIMTDARVEVELEIESATEKGHSRQITPDTPENDWWGETENWTTIEVEFTNGHNQSYRSVGAIDLVDE